MRFSKPLGGQNAPNDSQEKMVRDFRSPSLFQASRKNYISPFQLYQLQGCDDHRMIMCWPWMVRQPPFFYYMLNSKNRHFFYMDLSSKRRPHFFKRVVDFQGFSQSQIDWKRFPRFMQDLGGGAPWREVFWRSPRAKFLLSSIALYKKFLSSCGFQQTTWN